MAKYPYKDLGVTFDRTFRNDMNANFDDVETDIKEQKTRVDNIVASAGTSNTEIVDARYDSINSVTHTTLKARLDNTASQLAEKAKQYLVDVTDKPFNAKGDKITDDTAAFQSAIDYCVANKYALFVPFAKKEVYKITGVVDFKKIPVVGDKPLGVFTDNYTQTDTSTNSCLFLESTTAQIKNLSFARNIGISSKRVNNNLSSVIFDHRPTVFWHNVSISHSGLHGIELPYGAIPLFLDHVDIFRPKVYGIDIEGALFTGNPDADSNRVHISNSHISYSNNHGIYYNATGGIFTVEKSDITGVGEPTYDSGGPVRNPNAYAIYIQAKSGANNVGYSFRDLWLEAINNGFYFGGTLSGIEINNIKLKPFVNGEGNVVKFNGYVYGFNISNVKGTQTFLNFYDFDSLSISDDEVVRTFEEKNTTLFPATNKRKIGTNSFNFARKLGGYSFQTYPAGTVTASGASGANTYYTINTTNLADPRKPFTENTAVWIDAGGTDISLYVGGVYAGEVQTASTTAITTNKSVAIGDGSIEFRVKKKVYLDGTYYQPTIGKG